MNGILGFYVSLLASVLASRVTAKTRFKIVHNFIFELKKALVQKTLENIAAVGIMVTK